jgi:hypothetical protein
MTPQEQRERDTYEAILAAIILVLLFLVGIVAFSTHPGWFQ